MENTRYTLFILFIVIATAIFLRCYSITDRPMHSDEGVNFHFVQEMSKNGFYKYSHENYHGPSYFYLLFGSHSFFGSDEFFHRFPAILSGILLCLSPLLFLKLTNLKFILPSVILLSLSSSLTFYSRYSIHEMFLVLCTVMLMFTLIIWKERNKANYLLFAGFLTGLLISTKETFIISGFSICLAGLLTYSPKEILNASIRDFKYLIGSILVCIVFVISFYSGFFLYIEGVNELLKGIPQWIGRGHSDVGHHKPFLYYFNIIKTTEPIILLIIPILFFYIFKTLFLLFKNKTFNYFAFFQNFYDRVIITSALVCIFSFIIYSSIPYKTPWLVINITAPALICIGFFIAHYASQKLLYSIILILITLISLRFNLDYNFEKPSIPKIFHQSLNIKGTFSNENPFSYVQTTDGMIELVNDIKNYLDKNPEGLVLIAARTYWPLPYYLRNYSGKLAYRHFIQEDALNGQYGILVLNLNEIVDETNWNKKYLRLSGVQESNIYYKKNL